MNNQQLQKIADEVNNEWGSDYRADVVDNGVEVYYNHVDGWQKAATVTDSVKVIGNDDAAVAQLNYMLER